MRAIYSSFTNCISTIWWCSLSVLCRLHPREFDDGLPFTIHRLEAGAAGARQVTRVSVHSAAHPRAYNDKVASARSE